MASFDFTFAEKLDALGCRFVVAKNKGDSFRSVIGHGSESEGLSLAQARKHIEAGTHEVLGVRGGSKLNDGRFLCILDIDQDGQVERIENLSAYFSETLATFGSKGRHLWLSTDEEIKAGQIRKNEKVVADVIGQGKFLVIPPTPHRKTGKPYTVVRDVPIEELTALDFNALLGEVRDKQREQAKRAEQGKKADEDELAIFTRKLILPRPFLCGFDDAGRAYRGSYIADPQGNPEPVIILENGDVIREAFFAERGLRFKDYPAVDDTVGAYGWGGQTVKEYIEAAKGAGVKTDLPRLFEKTKTYFSKRGHFLNEKTPAAFAIWCFGTYLGDIITLPRILPIAPPGTGKSQICRAIRNVSAVPVLLTDSTKAALFRMAAGQTVIIDNFDKLPEEQKADVIHFAETTFEGDGSTYRVEDSGKRKIPTKFQAKTKMVIAGLGDESYSDALRSRSVYVSLEKRPEGVEIVQVPEAGSEPEADEIRRELYAWALANTSKIKEELKTFDCGKKDRQGKFYAGMLFLADKVGAKKDVESWLDAHVQPEEIEEFSEQGQVLAALWELVKEKPERKIQVLEVAEEWAQALGIEKEVAGFEGETRQNPAWRGKVLGLAKKAAAWLKAVPGASHSRPNNKSCFEFKKAQLIRYLRRFGIVEPVQKGLLDKWDDAHD